MTYHKYPTEKAAKKAALEAAQDEAANNLEGIGQAVILLNDGDTMFITVDQTGTKTRIEGGWVKSGGLFMSQKVYGVV